MFWSSHPLPAQGTLARMLIEEHISLALHTTLHIGGPARFFVRARSVDDIRGALACAAEKKLPVYILGGGSNVLVNDAGYDGVVIKIETAGVEREGDTLVAAAGESWDALVARAVDEGLWGIENLSGIPGTVGAAPVQNIGAYGCELASTLAWVEVLRMSDGQVQKMSPEECGFGYRTSIFKRNGGYVILRLALHLRAEGVPHAAYKDLNGMEGASLAEMRAKVLAVRAAKFPDLAREGTAGSFFLNPVVSAEKAAELAQRYSGLPQFAAEGGVKLSLAWLLDKVLNAKGLSVGGARLYEAQPLVIATTRGACARDVEELARLVAQKIKDACDIDVEREVRTI